MLPNRSKDGLSVSSSDKCENSFAFLAERTSAITLETISVKIFALEKLAHTSAVYTHGQIVDADLTNQSTCFALVML